MPGQAAATLAGVAERLNQRARPFVWKVTPLEFGRRLREPAAIVWLLPFALLPCQR